MTVTLGPKLIGPGLTPGTTPRLVRPGGGRVELEAELHRLLDADQATQSILCDEINP
jgi:hypothetical protein